VCVYGGGGRGPGDQSAKAAARDTLVQGHTALSKCNRRPGVTIARGQAAGLRHTHAWCCAFPAQLTHHSGGARRSVANVTSCLERRAAAIPSVLRSMAS
jgi:hypothetical protein